MMVPWWVPALGLGFSAAGLKLVNQVYRHPPAVLMVWRGFGVGLLSLPFVLFIPAPESTLFYILSFGVGVIVSWFDHRVYDTAGRFGAGVCSRLLPQAALVAMILWWALYPADFFTLVADEYRFAAVLACVGTSLRAVWVLKRGEVSRQAFLRLLPAIAAGGCLGVMNKTAIGEGPFVSTFTHYVLIVSFTAGTINLIRYKCEGRRPETLECVFSKNSIRRGSLIVLFNGTCMFLFASALQLADNPAYVAVLATSDTLWILLFNKIKHVRDETDIRAGFVLAGAAVGLILATS